MNNKIISIDTLKYYNDKISNYVDEKVSDAVDNLELDDLNAILVDTDAEADDPIVSEYITENELETALSSKMDKVTLANVATSGNYNDLSNKPTIPSTVTESTVSGWGFTKNTGTYSKPSGGIPKTDLTSAVQTSLGKADTALQSHQDISGKQDKLVSGTNIKTINGTSILGSGDITISGGGDYLPLTGGTITGDLTLTDGPGGAGNFQSYTVISNEFFSDIYYLERNGEHAVIMGNNKVEIINGVEQTKASIDWSGDGTKFLSNDGTYKTISGGGGSSSGSGAYAEVNHGTSDTTFTLTPNTFHVWDEVSALTLTLGSETAGVANEYLFQFNSGATATSLTLPDDIKWANDTPPTIAENMIYQVSILKGLASVLEFSNAIVFPVISSNNGLDNEEYAKVYEYFVNTYNLTSTSASPSNGVVITETLICDDRYFGGSVIKVSLNGTRLLLWTQKAIDSLTVPSITNLGRYLNYAWD